MIHYGVLKFVNGRISVKTDAPVKFANGLPFNATGDLCVEEAAPTKFHQANPFTAASKLALDQAGAITVHAQGGIPMTAASRIAATNGGVIAFRNYGLPFTAAGRLAVEGLTPPDPFFANVVLLALNDSAPAGTITFLDQSASAKAIIRTGNVVYSALQVPPGLTTSALFDGAGDLLSTAVSADFQFGAGDFTVEAFIRFNNASAFQNFLDWRIVDATLPRFDLNRTSNGGANTIEYGVPGPNIVGAGAAVINVWHHIAVARAASQTRLFVAGTQRGVTFADANVYLGNQPFQFGGNFPSNSAFFFGNAAAIRVTKGVARYTANFIVPTLPFGLAT